MSLPGGRGLLLRCLAEIPFAVSVHEGETDPIRGWVSPDYGRREPAPLVMFSTRAALPLRAFTLLLPTEDVNATPPALDLVGSERGPAGLRFASGETVLFREDEVVLGEGTMTELRERGRIGSERWRV